MAEESEKRFEAIMKKIFHAPPNPRPNSNDASGRGAQQLSGRKRPHSSTAGRKLAGNVAAESGGSSISPMAPVCRPWDRGDLLRRLSTFKSMNWFAKPQAVSPLECARRGWVNVDTDTIACVSCNTRLLFSTPSSWSRQQVEKAAMVFSLKLESGHNLLCPWINNSCTEELAQFPILSKSILIEDYKKRVLSLSQLVALPVITPITTIDNLIASQLEQFLNESSNPSCHEPLEESPTESSGHVRGTSSSISYYQAQKLISLFGWEPRILPYRVYFKDGNKSLKDGNIVITTGEKPQDNIQSSSSEMQIDPSSVVLDCKLCGASVGLWTFSTTPRPLEYIRFVGLTEVSGKDIAAHDEAGSRGSIVNASSSPSTSLGFTIAGGPPPASLTCSATISLPIVGQNLRARLPIKSGNKDLDVSECVGEGSNSNLSLTETVTDESSSLNRNGEEIDLHKEKMIRNHEEVGRFRGNNLDTPNTRANNELLLSHKPTEFDPIKQHRHFCPWITPAGKSSAGWQQTLSALESDNELSNVKSSTLIEVDDPVESVRNLFSSPEKKRGKIHGGS